MGLFGKASGGSGGFSIGNTLANAGQAVMGWAGRSPYNEPVGAAIDQAFIQQMIQAQQAALTSAFSGGYGSSGGYGGGYGGGGGVPADPDKLKVAAQQAQIDRDAIGSDRALREHLRRMFEKQQGIAWDQSFDAHARGGRQVKSDAVARGATTAEGTGDAYKDLSNQLGFALRNIQANQQIREYQDFVAQTQEANQLRKIDTEWAPLQAHFAGRTLDDQLAEIMRKAY